MEIAYFSNFLNHHQKLLSDELACKKGVNFTFVETTPMYDWLKQGGYTDYSSESYVLRAWENNESKQKAIELAKTVDVALFGGPEVLYLEVIRARSTDNLSFDVSERWLKRGWVNLFSPRLLRSLYYYFFLFRNKPIYKLCASAFCARDQYLLHTFKNKCYRWGYFTVVDPNFDVESALDFSASERTRIMWCSRFIKWKHPELPILLAQKLKAKGYSFSLSMFGTGNRLDMAKKLVSQLNLADIVDFKGNRPNADILTEMQNHDIFLFTSDRNEGWGAVANEAMSNGCVLVASDSIGSIPFLVQEKVSGMLFTSPKVSTGFNTHRFNVDNEALTSLVEKVEWLLNNPNQRKQIALNAYIKMRDVWSPANAAKNFLHLIDDLQNGKDCSVIEGPCSKAL